MFKSSFPIAKAIVKKLQDAGHIAYFAGGWVRDYLMKHPSDDIDIATSATVEQIAQLFPKTVPVGIAFGILIVVEGGHHFEVATFRKDGGYTDGRRPNSIEPATAKEDAQRRDFTINGLFYDPWTEEIYDYVEGKKDLEKGVIRAIGNPHERFTEDRLRMMRAVRYSTRFNFPIESDTLQAILAHASSLLPSVAIERIWQEFKKMALFSHFDTGLVTLAHLGLLQTIFPSLKNVALEEIQTRISAIKYFPKEAPAISQLLELFPEDGLESLTIFCDYLRLSREEKTFVEHLHHVKHLLRMPDKWREKLEPLEWAEFYASDHTEIALKIFAAHLPVLEREPFLESHYKRKQLLEQAILRLKSRSPLVRAEHLMAEGVQPGPRLGILLKEAEKISVNQGIEDRAVVIDQLKKGPLWRL